MPKINSAPLIGVKDAVDTVQTNLPTLKHGRPYTLGELIGKERWLSTPTTYRKQLGAEFKALALSGKLPVRWTDCRGDNSQVYELK